MNQPSSKQPDRGQNKSVERARTGVLLLVGSVAVALLAAGWYLSLKPTPPAEAEAPPPPAETTEAETALPAPTYARPAKHRDFSKRRGAPPRQAVAAQSVTNTPPAPSLEEFYGLHVCAARLSMGGAYLDLRYKVLDPAKAAKLANGKTAACLLDSASGTKLLMPRPPAEGAFPPTSGRLAGGRMYFAVVANRGGTIKSGSKVELLVGGVAPTTITVE